MSDELIDSGGLCCPAHMDRGPPSSQKLGEIFGHPDQLVHNHCTSKSNVSSGHLGLKSIITEESSLTVL